MDLLHAQFNSGHLSIEEIKTVLGNDFANWGVLSKKFKTDETGKFFNEKLQEVMTTRKEYTKSRKQNLEGHKVSLMDNRKEKIEDLKIEIEKGKYLEIYDQEMINAFLRYWCEKNKKGIERWKLEKTWETGLRLARWQSNDKSFKKENNGTTKQPAKTDGNVGGFGSFN